MSIKYTRLEKEEFDAIRAIVESVLGGDVSEQIMWRGNSDVVYKPEEIAPDKPIKMMDEQDAASDTTLDDETVDAIETDIENQIDDEYPEVDQNMAAASNFDSGSDAVVSADINDGDGNESTAESVIKMTVQMAIFKGIRDVADEFSKSFDIDKFALLARFQKYLLNPENLENASSSVVKLIKSKKKQQAQEERQQLIKQSRKDRED